MTTKVTPPFSLQKLFKASASAYAQALERTVDEALANAGMRAEEVDAVGVTVGPGLEVCLRVGCEGAKAIAAALPRTFATP